MLSAKEVVPEDKTFMAAFTLMWRVKVSQKSDIFSFYATSKHFSNKHNSLCF